MINPSTIRAPLGVNLKVVEVAKGLYTVQNAYEGLYEYFKDRPIPDEIAKLR